MADYPLVALGFTPTVDGRVIVHSVGVHPVDIQRQISVSFVATPLAKGSIFPDYGTKFYDRRYWI
ncbi:MAG TPA: hypothetical protein VHY08_14170 [Bacillota bacterium]|nr:hypothetical protein [Bacillota bacterium]